DSARVLWHPAAVRAVACTPPSAVRNWCLSGDAEGKGRLWDLDGDDSRPLRELTGGHRAPITAAAFSPDGKTCVTGSGDRGRCLGDREPGELRYKIRAAPRAAIPPVQSTPRSGLITAGRDRTIRLWPLSRSEARLTLTVDRRSGDVGMP